LNLKCLVWIYQFIRMDRQSILSKDLTKKGFFYGEGVFLVSCCLEAAWHFTACKIKDKTIKPYLYKQIGLIS
jgi:hypothetical protein